MEQYFVSTHKIAASGIEKTCKALGLELTMKGGLKTLPNNRHWHFKKGKLPGVLEITLLLQANKLILACKKNRQGIWVEEVVEGLKTALGLVECD